MSMRMNSTQQPPPPQPFPLGASSPSAFSPLANNGFSPELGMHGAAGVGLGDFASFGVADGQGNARLLQQLQAQQQQQHLGGQYGYRGGPSPSPPLHGRYNESNLSYMRGGVL